MAKHIDEWENRSIRAILGNIRKRISLGQKRSNVMEYSYGSRLSSNSEESGESKVNGVDEVDPMDLAFLCRKDSWRLYPTYTTYDSRRNEFVGFSKLKNVYQRMFFVLFFFHLCWTPRMLRRIEIETNHYAIEEDENGNVKLGVVGKIGNLL